MAPNLFQTERNCAELAIPKIARSLRCHELSESARPRADLLSGQPGFDHAEKLALIISEKLALIILPLLSHFSTGSLAPIEHASQAI